MVWRVIVSLTTFDLIEQSSWNLIPDCFWGWGNQKWRQYGFILSRIYLQRVQGIFAKNHHRRRECVYKIVLKLLGFGFLSNWIIHTGLLMYQKLNFSVPFKVDIQRWQFLSTFYNLLVTRFFIYISMTLKFILHCFPKKSKTDGKNVLGQGQLEFFQNIQYCQLCMHTHGFPFWVRWKESFPTSQKFAYSYLSLLM